MEVEVRRSEMRRASLVEDETELEGEEEQQLLRVVPVVPEDLRGSLPRTARLVAAPAPGIAAAGSGTEAEVSVPAAAVDSFDLIVASWQSVGPVDDGSAGLP